MQRYANSAPPEKRRGSLAAARGAVDPATAFALGAIWGAAGVRDACLSAVEDERRGAERRHAVELRRDLFEALAARPGMTHAELAAACGKTPSRLTQIVSDLDRLGLLATVRTGRVKRYRLSTCGAQVLEGLCEQDGGS